MRRVIITHHTLALRDTQAGVEGIGTRVEVEDHDQDGNVPDEDDSKGREV